MLLALWSGFWNESDWNGSVKNGAGGDYLITSVRRR